MYISGSDIPVIFGLGHITPHELFLVKKGELEIEQNDLMQRGKDLEDYIRKQYILKTGNERQWMKPNHELGKEFVHKDYPFLIGHLDDYDMTNNIVVEYKATDQFYRCLECPIKYQLQAAFYNVLANAKEAHIIVMHRVLELSFFIRPRMDKLESLIMEKALSFYNDHLIKDIAPALRTLDDIKESNKSLYQKINQEAFIATLSVEEELREYKELKDQVKENEKILEKKKVNLLNKFKNNEIIVDEYGNELATYKYNKSAEPTINKKILKEKYPEVYEEVKVNRTPSRMFRLK